MPSDGEDENEPRYRRSSRNNADVNNRRNRCDSRETPRRMVNKLPPPPLNHWRICFSGEPTPVGKTEIDVNTFIRRLKGYCDSAHISREALLEQMTHLLAGTALDWYQIEREHIHNWDDFERRVKAHFLPLSHDYELMAQANRRKQGRKESVAVYINAMRLISARCWIHRNRNTNCIWCVKICIRNIAASLLHIAHEPSATYCVFAKRSKAREILPTERKWRNQNRSGRVIVT